MHPIVIIGNGISALTAAENFRKYDKKTPVVIFSDEPFLSYYRMRLSGILVETTEPEKLYIRDPKWYKQQDLDVRINSKVVAIDTANKYIKIENGDSLVFSKLLLANGSRAFIPPVEGANLSGVFSLRNLSDVYTINNYIKDKSEGIIIGGGLLGLEIAWTLVNKGKKIHVIDTAPYILAKQLNETASKLLTSLGNRAGIEFLTSAQVLQISGNDAVESVKLKDGRIIPANFVIFSTGIRSNIQLVKDTPVKTNRGIIVNEYMQTSVEDVYAAGDVAEYKGNVFGIWPVAREQGKIAGLNLAGQQIAYEEIVPSNFLKVFGTEIFSVGNLCKNDENCAKIEVMSFAKESYKAVFFQKNTPVGAILLKDTKAAVKISKAIKAGVAISGKLIENDDFNGFLQEIESQT